MPVDDEGRTPMDSDKRKYPFTNRVDRVNEPNKDLWWVNPDTGKKVKSFTFEEPFNPYYDGDNNWLQAEHKQFYAECLDLGSFLSVSINTRYNEFVNAGGDPSQFFDSESFGGHIVPSGYMESNDQHEEGMRYVCTHQARPCEAQEMFNSSFCC